MERWKPGNIQTENGEEEGLIHSKYGAETNKDDAWDECRNGYYRSVLAVINVHLDLPNIITLCDPYLKKLTDANEIRRDVNTWQKIKYIFTRKPTNPSTTPHLVNPSGSAIDNFAMLAHTLLQQLTYTTAAVSANKDSQRNPDFVAVDAATTWSECVKIKDPRNANTLAFFGLAARMLKMNPPLHVNEVGNVFKNEFSRQEIIATGVEPRLPPEATSRNA